jgi:hypothetical protein
VVISWRRFGKTYRSNLQGSRIREQKKRILYTGFWILDSWPLKMWLIGCTETSVSNFHYSLRNSPEDCSCHQLRGESLKSHLLTLLSELNLGETFTPLTLILLTWTKWRAPINASKWRMGFNSTFKALNCLVILYNL